MSLVKISRMTQEQKNKKRNKRDIANTASITSGFTAGSGALYGMQHIVDKKNEKKAKGMMDAFKREAALKGISPEIMSRLAKVPKMSEYIKHGAKKGLKYGLASSALAVGLNRAGDHQRDKFWEKKLKERDAAKK